MFPFFMKLHHAASHTVTHLLSIGFGNAIVAQRLIGVFSPKSAPMKRLRDMAREEGRLIDATHGRKSRTLLIMDSNHVVLSTIQPETVAQRYEALSPTSERE